MSAASLRRGRCPGALRPMPTGDGLLVRIRPRGGTLRRGDAATLAACAYRYGNGHLDLTSRANLQIRGVDDATLPPLLARLDAAGLLDADAGVESVRNIVVSPLAGLDPDAVFDVRPVVAALEQRLTDDADLHALPAKFGIAVDDGGGCDLKDVASDLRFTATAPGRFRVALADTTDTAERLGGCASGEVADVAAALARVFLRHRRPGERMRDLGVRLGRDTVRAALATEGCALLVPGDAVALERVASRPRSDLLGLHPLGSGAYLGVAAPFGSLRAGDLAAFAAATEDLGAGEIRLTPWRSMLAVGLAVGAARLLATRLAETSLILDPADPRLRVAACPGAPACRNAGTDVRTAAATLAPLIGSVDAAAGIVLHVSGCRKGCARAAPTAFTLVAEAGRYDLVRDGSAGAVPVATGLSLPAAIELLRPPATLRETVP